MSSIRQNILFLFMFLVIFTPPAAAEEGSSNGAENSVCIYGAMITSEYWAYPEGIEDSNLPIHFPIAPSPRMGAGLDMGWGINRNFDIFIGYNHFLRGQATDVVIEGKTYQGPDSVSFSPIYVNIRYKTPFQFYLGGGFNYSIVGLTDDSVKYADAGNFGFQAFGGIEMRGTSGGATSVGLFGEIGYMIMTGFVNDVDSGTGSTIGVIQKDKSIYIKAGIRKYL